MDNNIGDAEFVHASNLRAVTLLARECGFESIQRSALEKLADLLELCKDAKAVHPHVVHIVLNRITKDLQNLLYNTHTYSELGNRTRPNYHDVMRSLEESGVQLEQIGHYLNQARHNDKRAMIALQKETPSKETNDGYHFLSSDDDEENNEVKQATSLPDYVPSYMPKFPSRHSFRKTPVYIHRPDDPQRVRELNSQQSRVVEENLKRLMSAENQLIRRQEKVDDDGLDLTVPIVNYEGAIQRKRRVKGTHSSDIRTITTKLEHSPNVNHHQTQLLQ